MIIEKFLCHTDNIAVLLHDESSRKTIAIDAPDGEALMAKLNEKQWQLDAVLITHHHVDHTTGISLLKQKTDARIFGPQAEKALINGLDETLADDQIFTAGFCNVKAIATPGHTAGALSYYLPQENLVFTGDTLFSLGCGRLFEGTPAMMFASLQKLRNLPGNTHIYCGHEYTLSNGHFALAVDPDNQALQQRMQEVKALRAQHRLTLPSSVAVERATNPFLRCGDAAIRENLGLMHASDEAVFTELRKRKDHF